MEARQNADFCESWIQYTEGQNTAGIYREWAPIMAISGALTRRVWTNTLPSMPPLYPNLFTMLVGHPGSGKDNAINKVRQAWEEAFSQADPTWGINVGTQSPSAKGLVDALNHDSAKLFIDFGSRREAFHSVFVCAPELSTVLPEYNPRLIGMLCELYNCNPTYGEQVRNGRGEPLVIEKPHTLVFAGGQPDFIISAFPEEAFGMGFFSRLIMVFSPEIFRGNMYSEANDDKSELAHSTEQWQALVKDLQRMARLVGKFTVPMKVRKLINRFHKTDCDATEIKYSRFKDYNTRRSIHAQKLAMCFSVSRGNDMTITAADWERALAFLLKTEQHMPAIFANGHTSRGFHTTIEEVIQTSTETRILTEPQIIRQIRRKHPPHEVPLIIQSMISGGDLEVVREEKGIRVFRVKGNLPSLKLVKGE
jgi:hypothetical protein